MHRLWGAERECLSWRIFNHIRSNAKRSQCLYSTSITDCDPKAQQNSPIGAGWNVFAQAAFFQKVRSDHFPKAKFQDIRDSEWTQVERQTEPKHGGARLVEAGQSTEGTSAEETGSASGTTCIASEETGSASETTDSEKARQLGHVILVNLPDSETKTDFTTQGSG